MKTTAHKRLFCDSEQVFNRLVEAGIITPDISVFTRSFVVANNVTINSIYIDENLSMRERQDFKLGISIVERKLFERLERPAISEAHRLIFLQLFNRFQNDILDGMLLGKVIDFEGSTLIAVPKTGSNQIDEVLRPNWIDWMAGMENVSLIDVTVPYHNERVPRGDVRTSIVDRLKISGIEGVLWKFAQQRWLSFESNRKTKIGVVGQSELSRDAVASCVLNGVKPVFINKPKVSAELLVPDLQMAKMIVDECYPIILDRLSYIPTELLRKQAIEILIGRLSSEIAHYKFFRTKWSQQLAVYPGLKCIISGYGNGPMAMAMADSCKEVGIKIAVFQHGITREILANARDRCVFYETSFSDLFFTMNKMSANITKNLCVNKKPKTIVKNWPSPFQRIFKKSSNVGKSILFVSTNLYSGHKPNNVPVANDRALCAFEKALVENIFCKVNKTIDYKPYPAIRQLDADPVIAAAKAQSNMSVIGTHEDLRYLLSGYEMFITSRATSTVSWIVATGKPLVFIDHCCDARLSDEARRAFSGAFFLFDQSENEFENTLKYFLQQPMEDIQEQWKAKLEKRSDVIAHFFSGHQTVSCKSIFNDIRDNFINPERNVGS